MDYNKLIVTELEYNNVNEFEESCLAFDTVDLHKVAENREWVG